MNKSTVDQFDSILLFDVYVLRFADDENDATFLLSHPDIFISQLRNTAINYGEFYLFFLIK